MGASSTCTMNKQELAPMGRSYRFFSSQSKRA